MVLYRMPRMPRRYFPILPPNVVYRSIQNAGGPGAVCRALSISPSTLARWRRVGRVNDAQAAFTWAALVHPDDHEAQLQLGRQLVGLPTRRR